MTDECGTQGFVLRHDNPSVFTSAAWKCASAGCLALTGQGYGDLAIQEGNMASLEFLRVTYGDVEDAEEERERVRRELEEYCGRDTEGMAWIVDALRKLAG